MKILQLGSAILLLFTTNHALAQKQEAKNITLEMEFAPLGSEPLKINSIRGRYFINENQAIRLSVFAGGKRTVSEAMSTDSSEQLKSYTGNFDFTIRPGFEHHFDLSSKMSPYLGGELLYSYMRDFSKNESMNSNNSVMSSKNMGINSSFGLNLLSGVDYYFTEKIYAGVELGFGFLFEGKGKTKTKYENQDGNSGLQNTTTKGNSTNLNWGPNYQGTIRLGYCIK